MFDSIPPSFYFPIRHGGTHQAQELLVTSGGKHFDLSAVIGFFLLQILGGHVGIPFVLLTLYFAGGIRRHPMLVNFMFTWVIYTTSFCILLYLGKQFGPEPPHIFCAIQSSLIYGTAILTPAAGLAFVLNLWFSLRAVADNHSSVDDNIFRKYTLIAGPYIISIFFVIFTAAYGASNPDLLTRNRYIFYCTINSNFVNIVPAIAAIIMFTIIIFEVLVAVKLYRMHKAFKHMRSGGPPLHLVVRAGVFSFYSFLSIVACVTFWTSPGEKLPYIIQASLPTAAFVIFGSQNDLLEVWGIMLIWKLLKNRLKPFITQSLKDETIH
ncbi:hypothetical protein PNOK_0438800 [Pyrrhoderma noxium]|uniref:Uncharacterized protein n=1 Tax=Pyrrhoderma noxium TaxID=2282107 RepID=A0A286UJ05_9AGAM|nr:hypothetical protein PNOK_0438800 [Pyrrhoderma noxium]